jgi:hypothetical protein
LEAIETLPLTDSIPYHSIIGDRGRGGLAEQHRRSRALLELASENRRE